MPFVPIDFCRAKAAFLLPRAIMPPCSVDAGASAPACCGVMTASASVGVGAVARRETRRDNGGATSSGGDAGACGGASADAHAERFFSDEALAREPHSLRALAPLLAVRAQRRGAASPAAHFRSRPLRARLFCAA
jgi:hypothetical protein